MNRDPTKRVSALQMFRNKKNDSGNVVEVNKKDSQSKKKRKLSVADDVPNKRISLKKRKLLPTQKFKKHAVATSTPLLKGKRSQVPVVRAVPSPIDSSKDEVSCGNKESANCFTWLISPCTVNKFFKKVFEEQPLYIEHGKHYFKGIFSCDEFDKILRNHSLEYKKNIDVVSYENGQKTTMDVDGRCYAPIIWDYFKNGYSIRFLNPQTYSKSVWRLCSLLQEYFGSFVGTNMYLTPPGSQGFAPHYDDIEAFVLQLEGEKFWKIYPPRENEVLPRFSSGNFSQDEIGQPKIEILLKPGDLLYFPRGFIHQASTPEHTHSLHITLSVHQKNTYGDLLERLLPQALDLAMQEDMEFRRSLPRNYFSYMGLVNANKPSREREEFTKKLTGLMEKLTNQFFVPDVAADLMAKDYIHSSLPPCLSQAEKGHSIHGVGEQWTNGNVSKSFELTPDTEIRFIRKRGIRLIQEEDQFRLYHAFENKRVYKEKEPQYVTIDSEHYSSVELLINHCPEYIAIEKLPLKHLSEQMDLATLLYDKGLVETKVPLTEDLSDSDSESE